MLISKVEFFYTPCSHLLYQVQKCNSTFQEALFSDYSPYVFFYDDELISISIFLLFWRNVKYGDLAKYIRERG